MATIDEDIAAVVEGVTPERMKWLLQQMANQKATIDALVDALERMSRVARVELGQSRPDIFEQANAALALARGER